MKKKIINTLVIALSAVVFAMVGLGLFGMAAVQEQNKLHQMAWEVSND